jgi:hypothetical protein
LWGSGVGVGLLFSRAPSVRDRHDLLFGTL